MSFSWQEVDPRTGVAVGASRDVVTNLSTGGSVSISADGRKLIYLKRTAWSNLWLLEVTESRQLIKKQLTSGTADIWGFSLSPDGRQIAFSAKTQDSYEVFIMPIEGGSRKQITFGFGCNPVWSPDGRHIAYSTYDGGESRVAVVSIDGGLSRTYSSSICNETGVKEWAPGKRILYQSPGNRNFRILDPETGVEQPLVTNDSAGWMFGPVYSHDGDRVAVYWNRHPIPGTFIISLLDMSQELVYK